jgi:hypothetical protein
MSPSTANIEDSTDTDITDGLAKLAQLPEWLLAPLKADSVRDALQRAVPEFASGALALRGASIKRMVLDSAGRWVGTYKLNVEGANGARRSIGLRGTFAPSATDAQNQPAPAVPLGEPGWQLALPKLHLTLESEPPESELPAMPDLTDPDKARPILEAGIRAGDSTYSDLQVAAARPDVLSYKPGSRCTIRYHLSYACDDASRGWPAAVIAKTYRKESKARNAYEGMVALWNTPLATDPIVAIAEPLAFIPELKALVQSTLAGDKSLEDLLKAALKSGANEDMANLDLYLRKVAIGLAALHRSGASHHETQTFEADFAKLDELADRLAAAAPELHGAAAPLLARLRERAAAHPADPVVPTHATFNPEQVLIDGERVGLIDFDDFCLAEPAMDVALFRAAIQDIGMNALPAGTPHAERQGRLEQLARFGDVFLDEYQRHAAVSRERVALWEAWSYTRDALHFWVKVKPAEPDNAMMMLTRHLRGMGLI